MKSIKRLTLLLAGICGGVFSYVHAENLIQVESQIDGRTYLIDVDAFPIREKLYSVTAKTSNGAEIPAWLLPYPGAAPTKTFRSDLKGAAINAEFQTGGTINQIADYYDQLLRSHQFKIDLRNANIRGEISLMSSNGTEHAYIRATSATGSVKLAVDYGINRQGVIGGAVKKMQMAATSWDDANGILNLHDGASGQDFYLRKRTIVNEDYNHLAEHQKTLRALPAWLTLYPGARVVSPVAPCKRKISEPPALCATLVTTDDPDLVWHYYKPLVEQQKFAFLRSGTNLDILASAILTVRVEACSSALRETVVINGNRAMSHTWNLYIKWSQLPPIIDIPDPDERTFDERVRRNRELQGEPAPRIPERSTQPDLPRVIKPTRSSAH